MSYDAMSMSEDIHDFIRDHLHKGATILEFGSGNGTAELVKDYIVYTVEHDEKWVGKVEGAHYIYAPLSKYTIKRFEKQEMWYNFTALMYGIPEKYDFIIVDGPTAATGRAGFYKFLYKFRTDVPILFDDVQRVDENELLKWCAKKRRVPYTVYPLFDGTQFGVLWPEHYTLIPVPGSKDD